MMNSILGFITAFVITYMAIPSIIKLAEIKHLFDEPGDRKSHSFRVPTLGGMGIFAGFIFAVTFWSNQKQIVELQYIICSILILFFMGIKDDLFNLVAYKKLVGQLLASFILVHFAGIRLTTFYGLFGVNDLSIVPSYFLSIFSIVVITNSINLIDGIDCLAGSVGAFAATTFGCWFYFSGAHQYSILSFSLVGSLLAFLFFNRTPAKIFMGDTGSLIVGLTLSILAIKYIEMNRILPRDHVHKILSVPVITIAILFIPLFDTLRVFAIRLLSGKHPLSADKNHLHHLLLKMGFHHMTSTLILICINIFIFATVYFFQGIRGEILLGGVICYGVILSYILAFKANRSGYKQVFALAPNESADSKAVNE